MSTWLNKILKIKIIIIFIVFINISYAKVVHIRVTEAMDVGIKLVVLPFNNAQKYSKGFNEISAIVTNDLNYSGQFKVLGIDFADSDVVEKIPTNANAQEIDFAFWRRLGAEYLLITKLYPGQNAANLIVNLQLLDLYKQYIDPFFVYENFSIDEQNEILKSKRSNNELDTTLLQQWFPNVLPIRESIINVLNNRFTKNMI